MAWIRSFGMAMLLLPGAGGPALAAQDTPPVPIAALDPRSLTLATEIIEIAFPPATRHAMLSRAMDALMVQARAATAQTNGSEPDEEARRILDRFMERVRAVGERQITEQSPALFTAMARAYARTFSYAELVDIRAFAGTPAGMAYMQRSQNLLADPDVARANTAYMASTLRQLEVLETQLREELRVHLQTRDRHRNEPTGGTH